ITVRPWHSTCTPYARDDSSVRVVSGGGTPVLRRRARAVPGPDPHAHGLSAAPGSALRRAEEARRGIGCGLTPGCCWRRRPATCRPTVPTVPSHRARG